MYFSTVPPSPAMTARSSAKAASSAAFKRSGPSLTVSSVEPTTSMKRHVTSRRSSMPALALTGGMLRAVPTYRSAVPSSAADRGRSLRRSSGGGSVSHFSRFARSDEGLATIEYIIGAAVVLGTLVVGVQAWNNGLVLRLQSVVTLIGTVL